MNGGNGGKLGISCLQGGPFTPLIWSILTFVLPSARPVQGKRDSEDFLRPHQGAKDLISLLVLAPRFCTGTPSLPVRRALSLLLPVRLLLGPQPLALASLMSRFGEQKWPPPTSS